MADVMRLNVIQHDGWPDVIKMQLHGEIRNYVPERSESGERMSEYIYEHSQCHDMFGNPLDAPMLTQREEVVRCRDCKHYGCYNGSWCRRTYEPVPSGTYDYQTVEPDGFCKWGVRREGADNG